MDTESLTYAELALRLGIKVDSARRTVRRKRWPRVAGNDGQVRISVPLDALPCPNDSPADSPSGGPDDSPSLYVRELETRIDGLRLLLQAETRRAETAEADRDRWHKQAVRPWWQRLAG